MLKISIAVFDRDFPKPFDMGRSIGVVEASNTPSPWYKVLKSILGCNDMVYYNILLLLLLLLGGERARRGRVLVRYVHFYPHI